MNVHTQPSNLIQSVSVDMSHSVGMCKYVWLKSTCNSITRLTKCPNIDITRDAYKCCFIETSDLFIIPKSTLL